MPSSSPSARRRRPGPGIGITSSSPASARRMPSSSSSGSTVARKPIVPKLTANTGTSRPRVEPQRREDRAVAAEHDGEVGVAVRVGAEHDAVLRLDAVLLDLVLRQAHLHPRLARQLDHAPQRARRSAPGARGVKTVRRLRDGSALRAAASRSSSAPSRPASAIQTKRLAVPGRAGQPGGREAEHRQAELRARELADGDQRRAPVVGRAHHAALAHALAAHLELGLDHREQVEARRRGARPRPAAPSSAR